MWRPASPSSDPTPLSAPPQPIGRLTLPAEPPPLRRFYLECYRDLIDPNDVIAATDFLRRNPHWLPEFGLRLARGRDISGE